MPGPITDRPLLLLAPRSNNGLGKHFLNKRVWIKQHWDKSNLYCTFLRNDLIFGHKGGKYTPREWILWSDVIGEILALIRDVTITKGK